MGGSVVSVAFLRTVTLAQACQPPRLPRANFLCARFDPSHLSSPYPAHALLLLLLLLRPSRLEIYSYWNQGGQENVLSMFLTLGDRYLLPPGTAPAPGEIVETPTLGLFHPLSSRYFSNPKEYLEWYEGEQKREAEEGEHVAAGVKAGVEAGARNRGHKVAPPGSPRVAVLLYRKHVITRQGYISQMIR